MMNKKTTDGIKILERIIGDDTELQQMYELAKVNVQVAQLIYDARTEAKLSQTALAQMIGTTQSTIACLEEADYEGDSMLMLNRIAQALNHKIKITLIPIASRQD